MQAMMHEAYALHHAEVQRRMAAQAEVPQTPFGDLLSMRYPPTKHAAPDPRLAAMFQGTMDAILHGRGPEK